MYQVYVKDLVLNENIGDVLVDISDNFVWGKDDSSIFYAKLDDQHRPFEVWLHLLGTDYLRTYAFHSAFSYYHFYLYRQGPLKNRIYSCTERMTNYLM